MDTDRASLDKLYDVVKFLGGIWTYPNRDAENQRLYEACQELEKEGKLVSSRHADMPRMVHFEPMNETLLGHPVHYVGYLEPNEFGLRTENGIVFGKFEDIGK